MKASGLSHAVLCALFALFILASGAGANTILENGIVRAEFDGRGLVSLRDMALGKTFNFQNDNCSVTVNGTPINTASLTPTQVTPQADSISYLFVSGNYRLRVIYDLKAGWRFVSRQIELTNTVPGTYRVNSVTAMTAKVVETVAQAYKAASQTGAAFLRFSSSGPNDPGTGLMLIQQNCFLSWLFGSNTFTMSYSPDMNWNDTYGPFLGDKVCIGTYQMSGEKFPASMVGEWAWTTSEPAKNGLDWAEVDAAQKCVRAFLLFNPQKATRLDVGWCSNDYQIDTSTVAGRTEHKRLIDMCAELGIDNLLYTPANSTVAPLSQNTDAWAWENVLWLNMGQKIRKGEWLCATGTLPATVQEMVDYAKSKGVGLVAYVYPSLGFKQNPEWTAWCGGNTGGYVGADTGVRSFQDWLGQQLTDFSSNIDAVSGYSFDHWWIAYDPIAGNPPVSSKYAQWFGCRRILENLRISLPDAIIDGRQQYQWFGPWTWLAGSYPHPTQTDEQPVSFRAFPDLHTDRVSANRQRWTAYWFRMNQFTPPEITPGYFTHQTQRYNASGGMPRTAFRTRDWDLLGWRFSLFSTIGTAPFHLVTNMIPARDIQEFNAMSATDKQFIRNWFDWVDEHIEYMRVIRPIIGQPMIGRVDGTAAVLGDNGFVFLFNPNYRKLNAQFRLDKSIGLTSGQRFILKELEPASGRLIGKPWEGSWSYGDTVSIPMDGTTALVLEIQPAPVNSSLTLFDSPGNVSLSGGAIQVTGAYGEMGTVQDVYVSVPAGEVVNSFTVNGRSVPFLRIGDMVRAKVRYAGERFGRCEQIGVYDPQFSGTTVSGTFSIPQRVFTQLQNRRNEWPVTYTADDLLATWLGSDRLLMFIHIADPTPAMAVSAKINGTPVTVQKSYNGVYTNSGNQTFIGFYIDVSTLQANTNYQIEVTIPALAAGQFQGLYFDNVEPEYTQIVSDVPPSADLLVKLDAGALPIGIVSRWSNTGTLGGSFVKDSTNPLVQNVAGRRAVVFNGSDKMKSTFPTPGLISGNGHYTVAYWVHNPSLSAVETVVSWAKEGTPGRGAQFGFGSSVTSGAVGHTGAYDMGFDGGVPSANEWHHIAVTFDGSVENVYVDGVLNATEEKTLDMWPGEPIFLGCVNGTSDFLTGAVSSVQIYDQALGASDIANLANTFTPLPIVDLNAALLNPGALSTWQNEGSLGGSFGNDGTNPQVQTVAGRAAVTFSGSDRMKSNFTTPASITGNNSWTYAAWVLNPVVATEECVFIWAHRGATGRNAQMNYGSDPNYGAVAHWNVDMGFEGGVPIADQWHHIAVTFDGFNESVYVDGKLNVTKARTLDIFAGDPMYIACANTGTAPTLHFSGSIASLQIYDRGLGSEDIVSLAAGPQDLVISDLKGLPDGSVVTLKNKTVTLAPRNDAGVRSTDYFYVEESNRISGIRVQVGLTGVDSVSEGDYATFTGRLRTLPSGERYVELSAQPQRTTGTNIKPLMMTSKSAHQDKNALALLVMVTGKVRSVANDGTWFTICDGHTENGSEVLTLVMVDGVPLSGSEIGVGQTVPVIGVVSQQGNNPEAVERVLLMRELPHAPPRIPAAPYSWYTGFEAAEGYKVGALANPSGANASIDQKGWVLGWNPQYGDTSGQYGGRVNVVSGATGDPVIGGQAMRLEMPYAMGGRVWWREGFTLSHNTDLPKSGTYLKYVITAMKIWRAPGMFADHEGRMQPAIWNNDFGFWYQNRYTDFWQNSGDLKTHGIVIDGTPKTMVDPGTPTIAGRYVDLVVFDDFVNHHRTVWYDGQVTLNRWPINIGARSIDGALNLWYGITNPWVQGFWGHYTYVDDIYVGWDFQ